MYVIFVEELQLYRPFVCVRLYKPETSISFQMDDDIAKGRVILMMSVTTLNALLPGVLPPAKEPDVPVDFLAILDDFDPANLSEQQLTAIAQSEPHISGYMNETTYTLEGRTFPVPPDPISQRLERGRDFLAIEERKLADSSLSYKAKRSALGKALRYKTCLYLAESQEKRMTEEERDHEETLWRQYFYGYRGGHKDYYPSVREAAEMERKQAEEFQRITHEVAVIKEYLTVHTLPRETVFRLVELNNLDLWKAVNTYTAARS